MCILNTLCAFSCNKKKQLTARTQVDERFKINVNLSLDLTVTE